MPLAVKSDRAAARGMDSRENAMDRLISRFVTTRDARRNDFVFDLPECWWNRPYEYACAAEFADRDATVLDAACGIEHPLKFYLAKMCQACHACDIDQRILDQSEMRSLIRAGFGRIYHMTSLRATNSRRSLLSGLFERHPVARRNVRSRLLHLRPGTPQGSIQQVAIPQARSTVTAVRSRGHLRDTPGVSASPRPGRSHCAGV